VKGNILKILNQHTPELLKKVGASYIRRKLITNKDFLRTYDEIEAYKGLTAIASDKLHFDKLKKILIYAYENTEFYKEIFNSVNFNPYEFIDEKQLESLPIINKNTVIDNFHKLTSREDRDYYEAFTGGSTGKPLKILLDTESIYKEKAFVYNFWSSLGYDYKKDKIATFRGLEFKDKLYKNNPIDNQIILNPFKLNKTNIEEYVSIIDKFKPAYLHGYPSAIYNFSRLLHGSKLKLKTQFKGIFFVSENIDIEERMYIEKSLNCKSISFYGHSERCVFAEEIKENYSFNKLYCHAEFIKTDEANVFKIVSTGLINYKMPLIRYETGDMLVKEGKKQKIFGHWDKEMLIGKNGEKVSMASINFHNDVFKKIKIYQFEQFQKGIVKLNIVEDVPLSTEDYKKINSILSSKLKGILDVNLNVVSNIELTKRGKHQKIVQHIK
jgi:phenylacetate-CoA ligase